MLHGSAAGIAGINSEREIAAVKPKTTNSRSGQALVLFALLFVGLAGILGLALDGTRLYFEKRRAQNAADAGAIAGAQEMRRGRRDYSSDVRPAAVNDAALHDYDETQSEVTVDVNVPPTSGPQAGNSDSVEVIVAKQVPTTLMRIIGPSLTTVRARAVAGLKRSAGDACVYVLSPDGRRAFKHNGTPILQSNCGILVNSTDAEAIAELGTGCVEMTYIATAGNYTGDCLNPTPKVEQPRVTDPMPSLQPPSTAGMASGSETKVTVGSSTLSGDVSSALAANLPDLEVGTEVTVFSPGYYSSQIQIQNGVALFLPGTYVLEKGMKVTGGRVAGSEVFFYNVNSNGNFHIDISSNERVTLSAPTSGEYKSVLFFNNRDSPDKSPGHKLGRGTLDSYYDGALYFPSQHLDWAGNPEAYSFNTFVVANTLNISGTTDMQVLSKYDDSNAPPVYSAVFWQ